MRIAPAPDSFGGYYYNGRSPRRFEVRVWLEAGGLRIEGGEEEQRWLYGELEVSTAHNEPQRVERHGSNEVLVIEDSRFAAALAEYRPPAANIHDLRWPVLLLSCAGLAAVAWLAYTRGVPLLANAMAALAPPFVEERLGQAVAGILAPPSSRCADNAAQRGLSQILGRLKATIPGQTYDFRLAYDASPVPNAFAAPGGQIVFFRGLLDAAETPEEFAGVLAHEMQHVLEKHPTRGIAREFSGRAILSIFSVDSAGRPTAAIAAAELLKLAYRREEEEEADRKAIAMMARAGMRPTGLASLLGRLQERGQASDGPATYLSTHPAMSGRVATLARLAATEGREYGELPAPEGWRSVCR
ncbi:MAG: M48 family metallopeptidase [Bryobacteraceae bacterium]|nr:M48 family metallopeptidase [Bryobacteraceae bacterium]